MTHIPVYSVVGWSGAGKTTLIERLVALWKGQGLRVSVVKKSHEQPDMDRPGKDTWRFSRSGAEEVVFLGPERTVRFVNRPCGIAEIVDGIRAADVILVEGHSGPEYPQIEVFCARLGETLRCRHPECLIALVSDDEVALPEGVRRFRTDEIRVLADDLLKRAGLRAGDSKEE